jgi:hypothetical protein
MGDVLCQRWREGRNGFRVYGERIDPLEYDVAEILDDGTAKRFVITHHYSGTYPAARRRYGLYRSGSLVGVAVFSIPQTENVLARWYPGHAKESVELGRFVLLDDVPGNGETWFLSRCLHLLRRLGYCGVVSFSDPMPRARQNGDVIFAGHLGGIYAASSAIYAGRTRPEALVLLPDGTVLSPRVVAKIRAYARGEPAGRTQGWRYGVERLMRHGAPPFPFSPGDPSGLRWCEDALHTLTRRVRHPGNLRYLMPLTSGARKLVANVLVGAGICREDPRDTNKKIAGLKYVKRVPDVWAPSP